VESVLVNIKTDGSSRNTSVMVGDQLLDGISRIDISPIEGGTEGSKVVLTLNRFNLEIDGIPLQKLVPTSSRIAQDKMEEIYEAMSLLSSMVNSGEKHSGKSQEITEKALISLKRINIHLTLEDWSGEGKV